MTGSDRRPVCRRCRHYRVTWDPARPHGCDAMGFKSARPPSEVVYENSGEPCRLYDPKERRPKERREPPGGG